MKVYAVIEGTYHEDSSIRGLFRSLEGAQAQAKELRDLRPAYEGVMRKHSSTHWCTDVDYICIEDYDLQD